MGTIETLFFDTYAFVEILLQNPNYGAYIKEIAVVTTKLNLMELYYGLFLKHGKEVAEEWYNYFLPFVIEIDDAIIKMACELKASLKKRKLSYVDCIGYIVAQKCGIKFLTGDRQFEDLKNVEFVR